MSRERTRELFKAHQEAGDVPGFFEALYADASGDPEAIPWADLVANPLLTRWLHDHDVRGRRCLVVGCGLGDDAMAIAHAGAQVTAFDISATAIEWARRRWEDTAGAAGVEFVAADLLETPEVWRGSFDLVVEIYTLQMLDTPTRARALTALAALVAPGGQLLIICRGRDADDPVKPSPPWRLSLEELGAMGSSGVALVNHWDGPDDEAPPVRRFVSLWTRQRPA